MQAGFLHLAHSLMRYAVYGNKLYIDTSFLYAIYYDTSTYIHTYMHTYIHTCIHTYIHTYIYTVHYILDIVCYILYYYINTINASHNLCYMLYIVSYLFMYQCCCPRCSWLRHDINAQNRHAACIGFYSISYTRSAFGIGAVGVSCVCNSSFLRRPEFSVFAAFSCLRLVSTS